MRVRNAVRADAVVLAAPRVRVAVAAHRLATSAVPVDPVVPADPKVRVTVAAHRLANSRTGLAGTTGGRHGIRRTTTWRGRFHGAPWGDGLPPWGWPDTAAARVERTVATRVGTAATAHQLLRLR